RPPVYEAVAVLGRLVGQPRHAHGGVVEYGRCHTRLLDGLVAVEEGGDPPQVDLTGPHRVAAVDHAAHGGVVADGVDDRAALHLDPGGQDLQGGHDILRRPQHVEDRRVRA